MPLPEPENKFLLFLSPFFLKEVLIKERFNLTACLFGDGLLFADFADQATNESFGRGEQSAWNAVERSTMPVLGMRKIRNRAVSLQAVISYHWYNERIHHKLYMLRHFEITAVKGVSAPRAM